MERTKEALRGALPMQRALYGKLREALQKQQRQQQQESIILGGWEYLPPPPSQPHAPYRRRSWGKDGSATGEWEPLLGVEDTRVTSLRGELMDLDFRSAKVTRDGTLLGILAEPVLSGPPGNTALFIMDLRRPLGCRNLNKVFPSLNRSLSSVKGFEWGAILSNPTEDPCHELFYTVPDRKGRPFQVRRLLVGSHLADSQVIMEEPDDATFIQLTRTKDHEFVNINLNSKVTSEVWLVPTLNRRSSLSQVHPILVRRRRKGVEYYVEHAKDSLYIITNAHCGGGELTVAQASVPGDSSITGEPPKWHYPLQGESWMDFSCIRDIDVFSNSVVLYCTSRRDGIHHMWIVALPPMESNGVDAGVMKWRVELPDELSKAWKYAISLEAGVNPWSEREGAFRFSVSSPVIPKRIYECTLPPRGESSRGNYVPVVSLVGGNMVADNNKSSSREDNFCVSRLQVASRSDGTPIPVTVIYPQNVEPRGRNPMLITAYGAYGLPVSLEYHLRYELLLEMGWLLAFAHVRGGSELGRRWHDLGKLRNKNNTFEDFQSCAEHLIEMGYSQPDRLVLDTHSAGSLIGGVMANRCPHLFAAMIMRSPFLDVLSALEDSAEPLAVHERDEWGDIMNCREDYDCVKSYSPLQNIGAHAYPPTLISLALNDELVNPYHVKSWVEKVRGAMLCESGGKKPLILLQIFPSGGHHAPSSSLKGISVEMAFLFHVLSAVNKNK